MLALHAQRCLLSSLLYRSRALSSLSSSLSSSSSSLLLIRTLTATGSNLFFSHSRRRSLCSVVLMDEANSTSGDFSSEHVSGDWYTVPELRLRDHRFTVPLDYSLNRHSYPKISVFAREVVAGNKGKKNISFEYYRNNRACLHSLSVNCCLIIFLMKSYG